MFRPTQFHGTNSIPNHVSHYLLDISVPNISLFEDWTKRSIIASIPCANLFFSPPLRSQRFISKPPPPQATAWKRRERSTCTGKKQGEGDTKSQERCKSRCSHSIYRRNGNYRPGTREKNRGTRVQL